MAAAPSGTPSHRRWPLMSDVLRARLKLVLRITFARRLAERAGVTIEDEVPVPLQKILARWLRGTEPRPAELRALTLYADRLNAQCADFRARERAAKRAAKARIVPRPRKPTAGASR